MAKDRVPLTAEFLRKLAAMVHGWPEKGEYYMIVSHDGIHATIVSGDKGEPLILSEANATGKANTLRANPNIAAVQVLGPFISPGNPGAYGAKVSNVQAATGRWVVPDGADLLCWTPSAFDKFVAPYYYMLYGSDAQASADVEALRQSMSTPGGSGIMVHRWPTSPGILENNFVTLTDKI